MTIQIRNGVPIRRRTSFGRGIDWTPTDKEIKQIQQLAKEGLRDHQIADILDVSRHAFAKSEIAIRAARKSFSETMQTITRKMINSAKRGDLRAIHYVLKARGGWRENDDYIEVPEFEGSYQEKCAAVDDALRAKSITLGQWEVLHKSLALQYSQAEYSERLERLEKAFGVEPSTTINQEEITDGEINDTNEEKDSTE